MASHHFDVAIAESSRKDTKEVNSLQKQNLRLGLVVMVQETQPRPFIECSSKL